MHNACELYVEFDISIVVYLYLYACVYMFYSLCHFQYTFHTQTANLADKTLR